MYIKKGFTITEIIVSLLVMAALATALIPTFTKINPNKEHIMFRKAYYLITNLVYELVNDEELYPEPAETTQLYNLGNTSKVMEDGEEIEGETKFCKLMISRLNIVPSATEICVAKSEFTNGTAPDGQFKTSDGMTWILPITKFDNPDKQHNYPIYIDVNGDSEPNCAYAADTCEKPDRFTIFVRRDGKINIQGAKEIQYLEESNVTKS